MKLTTAEKQLPYEAPYGYFENLERRTLRKLDAEAEQAAPWSGLAFALRLGMVLLVFALGWFLWQQPVFTSHSEPLQPMLAAIEAEDRVAYLLAYGDAAIWMPWVEVLDEEIALDWSVLDLQADDVLEDFSIVTLEELLFEL